MSGVSTTSFALHALSIALALVASPVLARDTPCPSLPDAPTLACTATAHGWFYAEDAATASRIADDAASAAADFQRHFGRAAPRGAVIAAGSGQAPTARTRETLESAGASWQLPWLDAKQRRELQRSALMRELRSRMPDAGDADIAARIDTALPATSTDDAAATDRSALRHEIGHMLLIRAFWGRPSSDKVGGGHYGGPGPDWLDETAAVLMESEAMADRRRDLLVDAEAGRFLVPLAAFFAKPHPMTAHLAELKPAGGEGGVRVISGEAAQRLAGDARWFYAQARGVADFLIATSGRDDVFGSIAAFLAEGGDMDGWLAAHGAASGLPGSVAELEVLWRVWLADRKMQNP